MAARAKIKSDERERVAKQPILTRAALVAEEIASNFCHLEAASNVDIVPGEGAEILQYGGEYGA
jgi:biotin synthase-like enzyme